MEKVSEEKGVRYKKKVCQLYYQDKIWELYYDKGKSIREVTEYINKRCIPHTKFKGITLSRETIHKIIKRRKTK